MLLTEWNLEEAKVVWREEGIEEGMEKGMEKGMEEGIVAVARNALAEGASVEFIQKITGLDREAIQSIQAAL
jgi:predicted transposase/invertase (TIGR01784 family)